MKSTGFNFVRTIASALLCLCAFASASFAATDPLNAPQGLAVDGKGNLYVANSKDNNILVFSPGFAQQSSDTITAGISRPSAVAFDPLGHLWVANYAASTITEYVNGTQNTAATISSGVQLPQALAIDSLDNVWVNNNNSNVAVYAPPYVYSTPSSLVRTVSLSYPAYGITVAGGAFSWGSSTSVSQVSATTVLLSGGFSGYGYGNDTGIAMAADASGNVYMGNLNGSVNIASPLQYEYGFIQLSFPPAGIAVDNVRGRVYFSNYEGNSISVYNTAGKLLHTIK